MTDANLIRRLRGDRTQAEYAGLLNVTPQLISWWEKGGAIGAKGQATLIRLHPDRRDAIVEEVLRRQEPATTTARWRAWFAFVADLRADGYQGDNRNPDDRAAAEDSPCPRCQHPNRDLQGFRNTLTGSYRAFALCSACGASTEF